MKHTIVPIAISALFTAGCGPSPGPTAAEHTPIAVVTARVESTPIAASFEAGGVVRARATAVVASRLLAPVLEVHVRPGDRVRRGAPLVTLDGRQMAAEHARAAAVFASAIEAAAAAEADVSRAEADAVLARATLERIRALRDKNSATPQELDQATASLSGADAQLNASRARRAAAASAREAAQAAVAASTIVNSYAVLTAPFDGVITARTVDVGSMAVPGGPLVTLEDTTAFRLELSLDEARAAQLAIGQNVAVARPGSAPGERLQGRVTEVARIDPTAHSFLVKIDLPADEGWRSGGFARATITGPERLALAVPASAAVRRGQLTFVYAVDTDGRARLRAVSPGIAIDSRLEVLAGLREGERIVSSPPAALSDGNRVSEGQP